MKNVADICHESNYHLCTLSHMWVVKFPNLYDFSALQQVGKIFCSIGYVTNQNLHIYTLHLTTFFRQNKKRGKKLKKR